MDSSERSIRTSTSSETSALASVIVNNYNYGRYLPQAIDSALQQTYRHTEIIVVDDGSTDGSRDIIARYGSRVKPVLKSNGGQASALNAGFAASRGDAVIFLDADDLLYPAAVANAMSRLAEPEISKVQWPLEVIDQNGVPTGQMRPPQLPAEGDFRERTLQRGPSSVASSPTSGNAWSRSFLEQVLPIPENAAYYRLCADEYLYTLAPVFGRVKTVPEAQGAYRVHGANVYSSRSFLQKLELELSGYDEQCRAIGAALARNHVQADIATWKRHSWFHRLQRAVDQLLDIIPEGSEFVLIDAESWDLPREFSGRKVRPFITFDGLDGGPPADDEAAILYLNALVRDELPFLAVGWPCFWWFDEYPRFSRQLHALADRVSQNDAVIIFDFGGSRPARPLAVDTVALQGGPLYD